MIFSDAKIKLSEIHIDLEKLESDGYNFTQHLYILSEDKL